MNAEDNYSWITGWYQDVESREVLARDKDDRWYILSPEAVKTARENGWLSMETLALPSWIRNPGVDGITVTPDGHMLARDPQDHWRPAGEVAMEELGYV